MEQNFSVEAHRIVELPITHRVNSLGGYGPGKEVIYQAHPFGAPAEVSDKKGNTAVSFLSNGSIDFRVNLPGFPEIVILAASFEKMDKREINVPAQNIWIEINGRASSIINPHGGYPLSFSKIKIVKITQPHPAMWYCTEFDRGSRVNVQTAVKLWLTETRFGPVLRRDVFIKNKSQEALEGNLWLYFNLPATMEYTWDRDIWYNRGLPLSGANTVIASTVPNRDIVQLKQVTSDWLDGLSFKQATCDYISFIGHSAANAFLPLAVQKGELLKRGAGRRINRFNSPTIAANRYDIRLPAGGSTALQQSLLFVMDETTIAYFRRSMQAESADFDEMEQAFRKSSQWLVDKTAKHLLIDTVPEAAHIDANAEADFEIKLPGNPKLEAFFSSALSNIDSHYNRTYGRRLADGVEIGMRDRAQDMWLMMKIEPEIVRQDLIYTFSMMYSLPDHVMKNKYPLSLAEKLHGMFPRQYPSRWSDRSQPVENDNRPYADSALWPVETLLKYINETGDIPILKEEISTSTLTDFDHPLKAKMKGLANRFSVFEVVKEILNAYGRHIKDSPYGMAQILFGDWADPIGMIGASIPGDASTRGKGRGTSVRLSAHLFLVMVKFVDLLRDQRTQALFKERLSLQKMIKSLSATADRLRKNILKYAWEETDSKDTSGFISYIHEFNLDGSVPDYKTGETGYTIGSMLGKDYDSIARRELLANAYGMEMIAVERSYLQPVPGKKQKINDILNMTDHLLSDEVLGVKLFSHPIANNEGAIKYCGRMGMIPAGCAENGEYHHAGHMMQYFRWGIEGQVEWAWKYYKPLLSVYRNEYLNGPFDMLANSYASDGKDPHFGAGMLFGSSGSIDWMVEIIERAVGLELNLFDSKAPELQIIPRLPKDFGNTVEFRRKIHFLRKDKFVEVPLRIRIKKDKAEQSQSVIINGKKTIRPQIKSLQNMEYVDIIIKL